MRTSIWRKASPDGQRQMHGFLTGCNYRNIVIINITIKGLIKGPVCRIERGLLADYGRN